MSWYVTEENLSPKQRIIIDDIVNSEDKYFYIRGFTGTGKSLILLHIIEKLIKKDENISVCFLTYTDTLVELAKTAPFYDSIKDKVPFLTNRLFLSNDNPVYDCVLVDEIQDMPIEDLIKLRTAGARLICAGDFNQQIYLHRVTESELLTVLSPVVVELTDIYRLTKFLCKLAFSVAPKTRLAKGLRAHSNPVASIELRRAEREDLECLWVWREANALAKPGRPSVVMVPTFRLVNHFATLAAGFQGLPSPPLPVKYRGRCDYSEFNAFWRDHGVNLRYVDNLCPSLREGDQAPFVFLMTYHASKGLSFKNVFIPLLSRETTIIRDNLDLESRLLFTACTRANERLFLSYTGDQTHHLIANMPPDCYQAVPIPDDLS
jgi:superfamily I DNA/RNA helicase